MHQNLKLHRVAILCALLVTFEVEITAPGAMGQIRVESKTRPSNNHLVPPNFSSSDVNTVANPRTPPGDLQLKISWDGLDIHLNPYPFQVSADIYVDGIPSGYQVDPKDSTNIYLPSVVHAITLVVSYGSRISPPSRTIHSKVSFPKPAKVERGLPFGPPLFPSSTDPMLNCQGSGEILGDHPGWSSSTAVKLTVVTVDPNNFGIYWCPARAPFGAGVISYTVTATPDAITCETTDTYCLMPNTIDGKYFTIMATDRTGSYQGTTPVVPNSGLIESCTNLVNWCNIDAVAENYSTFGNLAPELLGDCTFAAVADWEEAYFGLTQSTSQIVAEFARATGKKKNQLTNDEVFAFWQRYGIGDTFLKSANHISMDPVTLKNNLDMPINRDLIAQVELTAGENFAGYQMATSGYHWIVVDGYTPKGPVIITWGQILQMTWQQWNYDALNVWSITTK